ncbi:NAD-dependent epimerase/dehydratase family protein [Vibrio misgurnus]|uniref:NAD-dependent epimerase/dehydratase family protein n=1 Tax=Vibrio misgurnus TaxID=2993714 RepID=UPI002416EAE1|nr:NAD-dependent epimerase/dehydratase family protein [Vibrio sp. gvc]
MSILLTGATGFVGSFISNNGSNDIRCVIRDNDRHKFKSIFTITNLDRKTKWQGAFSEVESVIHLAGLAHFNTFTSEEYHTVNVDGTLNLAYQAASAGVKRFVFVSSIGVNGTSTQNESYRFDSPECPHNAYAKSKHDAELGLRKISIETGLEVVIVRPTLVYGPEAPGNFGMLTKLILKFPFLPFGLTENKRDFIAVQNLADLLITCAKHPDAGGHTFLASDGETVSIKDFTNAIAIGLNKKLIQLPVPVSLMRFAARLVGKSAMAEQLLGNLQVDSSNAKEVLGWTPPYTMEQAMASLSENKK